MAIRTSISGFISEVAKRGGIASSNSYDLQIKLSEPLKQFISGIYGTQTTDNFLFLRMLCNEIQIPGMVYASADIKSPYKGINVRLPYAKIYNSLDLSFVCDMESVPYRVFRGWQDWISNNYKNSRDNLNPGSGAAFYFRYYDDIVADIEIIKLEKTKGEKDKIYQPFQVILRRAYPYSVTSIPLSAASAQLVKVTVSMYYEFSEFKNYKESQSI